MTATMTKQEHLAITISALRGAIPELRGVLVATTDGLPIAQSFSDGTDGNRVAAMAATALGLGKRINESFGAGDLNEMSVSGVSGGVFFYAAGRKGVLAVVAPVGTNLGLLHLEARDAAHAIASIL